MKFFEKIFGRSYSREAYKRLKRDYDERSESDPQDEDERPELEKNDFAAMLLAALITFVPAIMLLVLIMFGAVWLFGRAW